MATLIFCHGRESGPQGTKISALGPLAEASGWQVVAPDFRDLDDPDRRVERLLEVASTLAPPLLLIGSSMGGYVAARASVQLSPAGLLLLAPAIGIRGYTDPDPTPCASHVEVIHGWQDDIVAPHQVFDWCARHRLSLHMVDDDHPLTASLPFLQQRLEILLAVLDRG